MDDEFERNPQMKNISYLRARDPSIISWNHHLSNVRMNLNDQLLESTATSYRFTKDDNQLKTYLRIKNNENFKELYEIVDDSTLLCKVPEGAQCIRNLRDGSLITKTFKFSKIFGPQSTQTHLFNGVVKEKVLHFINGYNCSLLTYGASGSGKTFTIVGNADEPGIIPRALEYLFRTLPQLSERPRIKPTASGGVIRLTETACEAEKNIRQNLLKGSNISIDRAQHTRTYKAMQQRLSEEPVALILDDISDVSLGVWVSYVEIYNEHVYDLLGPEPPRGIPRRKLRLGYSNGNAYIKDLTCISVSSGLQAYHILQHGLHNLKYAATPLNDRSSRSHSIFTIKLAQASDTREGVHVSSFNFCDLAGSERLKMTNNAGDRLKESNNINTSLLVLGRCVSMVRESQKHNDNRLIPFRESKLTQLFQKALLGHEAISMMVNINPTREMFDESQHVLNFSAVAKDVVLEEQHLVKIPKSNGVSQYLGNKNTHFEDTIEESEKQELEEQIKSFYYELQQEKLDAEDKQQHIRDTYKKLLEDTNKLWEGMCKELEDQLIQHLRETHRSCEQPAKKLKTSIITLDSSTENDEESDSEEENDVDLISDKPKNCREKICDLNDELVNLKAELTQVKSQLQFKGEKIEKLMEKNKSLQLTLEDAQKAYSNLKSKYEYESRELNLEIIQKKAEISELNSYVNAFHKVKAVRCENDDNKENDHFASNSEASSVV